MTTRKPVMIGPFSRGLNTYDDPTALHDQECAEALNFDPGLDGSLKNRPPFTDTGDPLPMSGAGSTPRLLGYFYDAAGNPYLIANDGDNSTWVYASGTWTLITNTFAASDMAQFNGKAWLLSPVGEADPGGTWTPVNGFAAEPNMPRGTSITSYKSRLWVAHGVGSSTPTRVSYSKVLGQPGFWQVSNPFVDIGAGDGQNVVKILTYYDTMLVFRTKSIWSFRFSSDPAAAVQGVVVPGVGLQSRFSLVTYENYIYFMYDEKAYQFINNRAQQINIKVPFRTLNPGSTNTPYTVSLFNNRVLFSFYEMIYVYSLRTQTWTTWRSDAWGPIGQLMMPYTDADTDIAYALPSSASDGAEVLLLRIDDRVTSATEDMFCVLLTKNYNFDVPGSFKVLFWWGIDAIFKTNIQGQVIPGIYNLSTTWGSLFTGGVSWGSLLGGTWSHPYLSDPSVISEVLTGPGPVRKFVKFFKKLRFRQIQFRITFRTDGSETTAPVQIFTLSTYMAEKQTVSRTVS